MYIIYYYKQIINTKWAGFFIPKGASRIIRTMLIDCNGLRLQNRLVSHGWSQLSPVKKDQLKAWRMGRGARWSHCGLLRLLFGRWEWPHHKMKCEWRLLADLHRLLLIMKWIMTHRWLGLSWIICGDSYKNVKKYGDVVRLQKNV